MRTLALVGATRRSTSKMRFISGVFPYDGGDAVLALHLL
jgi:hypothetical protein